MNLRSAVPLILVVGLASACDADGPTPSGAMPDDSAAPAPPEGWLRGTVDERFDLVSKHLRGFDMAMVEVGYRFRELHWAGENRNWAYAEYQIGKIETAVENGVERRPARAASARMLDGAVSTLRSAIERRDGPAMDAALATLTATCNACHQAERVPFIHVLWLSGLGVTAGGLVWHAIARRRREAPRDEVTGRASPAPKGG
jgi:hypothetical protein